MFVFFGRPGWQDFGMDKRFLEDCLAQGLSLDGIAQQVGKHPSTVSYWLAKYGLQANGAERHAPRGGIDWEVLEMLADDGLSLSEMAEELGRSISTIRHWLKQYGLQSGGGQRRRASRAAKKAGSRLMILECRHHGRTKFVLEGRGYYRCMKCRSAAVARRRRVVKQTLVEEAGGKCALCGYDRSQGALQFHHLEPREKAFPLSRKGISRSIAKSRIEARKCVLLCANCHAEVENGVVELPIKLDTHDRSSEVA
jgi:transposase